MIVTTVAPRRDKMENTARIPCRNSPRKLSPGCITPWLVPWGLEMALSWISSAHQSLTSQQAEGYYVAVQKDEYTRGRRTP